MSLMPMKLTFSLLTVISIVSLGALHAEDKTPETKSKSVVMQKEEIKMKPAPGLPPGVMISVLMGDLNKAEPYIIRFEIPDCYVVPPHWHTNDEEVVVLEGTFYVGFGEIDTKKAVALKPGGFELVPGKEIHYVWGGKTPNGKTIVQLSGMGPRDTHFTNPKELISLFKKNNTCPS